MRAMGGLLLGAALTLGIARASEPCPYDRPLSERAACVFTESGAETAENLVTQNRQFLRILYGRNDNTLVLELLHARSGVTVIVLRDPHGKLPPIVTQLPSQQWLTFTKRWETLEEDNAAAKKLQDAKMYADAAAGIERVCLHAPFVVMQAGLDAGLAVREGSACVDPFVTEFAYEIAEAALAAEPDCALLQDDRFGLVPNRLASCLKLSGNRRLAASVYNQAVIFEDELAKISAFLAPSGVISIAGKRFGQGSLTLAQVWSGLVEQARYPFVVIDRVQGSATSAVLTGSFMRLLGDTPGRSEQASWQEEWRLQKDGSFKLARLTVGAFHPPQN